MKSTKLEIKTNWERLNSPRICGLLAKAPTSFSKVMHNSGFNALGLPFSYGAFKVESSLAPIQEMREKAYRGYSVTIPFKEEVIPFLDELCPIAKEIGAVNTIINSGEKLYGINTDWVGVCDAFFEIRNNFSNDSCLIIGAGGAAKACAYALIHLGVEKITFTNRTIDKAKILSSLFSNKVNTDFITLNEINKNILSNFSIIINTTPQIDITLGDDKLFPYDALSKEHLVFDMITGETRLSLECSKRDIPFISGFRMLLHQAYEQFELFTENSPPKDLMEKTLIESIGQR